MAGWVVAPGSRFAALDGLRATAVLLVFVHHVDQQWLRGGWLGVDLFFLLSGFLITTLLLREHDDRGRIDLKAFYLRRLLRLMPALLVLVVVVLPLSIWRGTISPWWEAFAASTYLMDVYAPLRHYSGGLLGHTWSLAVEEQFYLVLPVALILALRRRLRLGVLTTIGIVGCVALGAATAAVLGTSAAYRSPFAHVPVMLIGVLLALAVRSGRPLPRWTGSARLFTAAAAVVLAASFVLGHKAGWLYAGGFVVVGVVLLGLLAPVIAAPTGRPARLLSARPLVWLGERSYGFYLWHYPTILLVQVWIPNPVVSGLLALGLTVLATLVSWRVVEQPFLRLKQRFAVPATPATPAVTAADPARR